jgi:predicted metal-dependent phosphotriesterase family hydrolase
VEAMHARGFTDSELDMMFKENPAKLLGLATH